MKKFNKIELTKNGVELGDGDDPQPLSTLDTSP